MNTTNCTEMLLDDVVSIALYPAEDCQPSVPVTVVASRLASFTATATASFTVSLAETEGHAKMDATTLKLTTVAKPEGRTVTHDLAIPIIYNSGHEQAEQAQRTLAGRDFHVIYTHADGHRSASLALPNTASIDIEESVTPNATCTLKVKLTSMSTLIPIDEES